MAEPPRQDLLAKIKKCLALAKGASEHEAAAALAKARELMDLYGLDEADVALAEVGESSARFDATQRPPQWMLILTASIRRVVPVHCLLGGEGITFVGLTPAPEVASYAFTVLHRQLKQARSGYIKTQLKRCSLKRKRARADLFCEGWAAAVHSAITRLYGETPLDPLVRRYLDEKHANLGSVSGRSAGLSGQVAADDRARGREAGRNAQLHVGVGQTARPLALGQSRA